MSNIQNLQGGGHKNDVIVTSRDTNQTRKQANNGEKRYMTFIIPHYCR